MRYSYFVYACANRVSASGAVLCLNGYQQSERERQRDGLASYSDHRTPPIMRRIGLTITARITHRGDA